MRQYFINEYDKSLKDNSVLSEDKYSLTMQINNLNTLINTIKSEKDTVLNKENLFIEYQTKINEIVKADTIKIHEIDTAAKAVVEAEEKAKKEVAKAAISKAATSNNTPTPKATAPNTSKQTNNSNIPKNGHARIIEYTWALDAKGNEVPGSRISHYEDGSLSGADGVIHTPDTF